MFGMRRTQKPDWDVSRLDCNRHQQMEGEEGWMAYDVWVGGMVMGGPGPRPRGTMVKIVFWTSAYRPG